MIHLIDGPAAGIYLALRRAPRYLRVVIGPEGGQWRLKEHPPTIHPTTVKRHRTLERKIAAGASPGELAGQMSRHFEHSVDALDQPTDTLAEGERIHVYVQTRYGGPVFIRPGGRYEMGDYRWLDTGDEDLTGLGVWTAWTEWVTARDEAADRQQIRERVLAGEQDQGHA